MVMINNNWEFVTSVDDICRIIEEKLSAELANSLKGLIDSYYSQEEYEVLEKEIESLNEEVEEWQKYAEKLEVELAEYK